MAGRSGRSFDWDEHVRAGWHLRKMADWFTPFLVKILNTYGGNSQAGCWAEKVASGLSKLRCALDHSLAVEFPDQPGRDVFNVYYGSAGRPDDDEGNALTGLLLWHSPSGEYSDFGRLVLGPFGPPVPEEQMTISVGEGSHELFRIDLTKTQARELLHRLAEQLADLHEFHRNFVHPFPDLSVGATVPWEVN